MVVKIQNSYPSMRHTLNYNEDKVSLNEAERIAVFNIPQNENNAIREIFDKYERWNIRSTDVSFQMSINPNQDAGEQMTDDKAIELAYKIMAELGYGNQPIVIYRHNDIDREHYHVVSIRTNEKGKKIRDRQEQNKLQRFLRRISKEYGFVIGNQEPEKDRKTGDTLAPVPAFSEVHSDSLSRQYLNAFEKAMQYHFKTFTQFKAIMRWYGVDVSKNEHQRQDVMCLQGIDQQEQGCSPPLREYELGRKLLDEMNTKALSCREDKKRYLAERKRLAEIFKMKAYESRSLEELKQKLKDENIGMHVSRNKDGRIFGLTLIDHDAKIAFKGTEIAKSLNIEILNALENNIRIEQKAEEKIVKAERNQQEIQRDSTSDSYVHHDNYIEEQKITADEVLSALADMISVGGPNSDSGYDGARPKRNDDTNNKKKKKRI